MSPAVFEVIDRTSAPYSSICYIQVVFPDGTAARASGVVIGVNDVLTALHVVFETAHGGWATTVQVIPAAHISPFTRPFGTFSDFGSLVGRAGNWDLNGDGLLSQTESSGDLALIGLKSRIGDVTGVLPVAQVSAAFDSQIVGFPAAGAGMMAENIAATPSSTATVYTVEDSLGPGASGGPILDDINGRETVVGVLSSGTSDETRSTYAGLWSADTWSWLQNSLQANLSLLGGTPLVSYGHSGMSYVGKSGGDTITGTAGWDSFTGNGGANTFDGGPGIDLAVFHGTRSQYTVNVGSSGVITVSDTVPGRDGTDTLISVERLQFSDGGVAFDVAGDAGEAYRLYQAAFSRAPDLGGMGFQMHALDSGLSLSQVAGNFMASPEFRAKYGTVDDAQFIALLYQNVLHRSPVTNETHFHLNELVSGQSRADLLTHFAESPENQVAILGSIQNGIAYVG